jgi:hypothetical protein
MWVVTWETLMRSLLRSRWPPQAQSGDLAQLLVDDGELLLVGVAEPLCSRARMSWRCGRGAHEEDAVEPLLVGAVALGSAAAVVVDARLLAARCAASALVPSTLAPMRGWCASVRPARPRRAARRQSAAGERVDRGVRAAVDDRVDPAGDVQCGLHGGAARRDLRS